MNLLLVVVKFGLAMVSGSLALAADAIHSLVDVVGSLVVLSGVLIARRRSKSFPYGLYKVENFVSIVLAFLIFFAGYEIAREAWYGPAVHLADVPFTLAGVAAVVLMAYLFSRYQRRLGEKTGSPSLIADSQHFSTDVLSSAVVFVAILGSVFGLPFDRVGAIVVVLFILWAGWGLLVDGMRVLLDASLSHETLDQVRNIISANPGVVEIRSLVGRNSGRYKFIEAELVLRTRDLAKAHQISSRIEEAIRSNIPRVDRVLIHYEPMQKDVLKWAIPLEAPGDHVSPHLGMAPYFDLVSVRTDTGEVVDREVLANPYVQIEKQKGIRVAEFLVQHGVDGVALRERLEGKGASYVLADAGIEVMATRSENEQEVLGEIRHAGS